MGRILFDKGEKWLVRDAAVRAVGVQCAAAAQSLDTSQNASGNTVVDELFEVAAKLVPLFHDDYY